MRRNSLLRFVYLCLLGCCFVSISSCSDESKEIWKTAFCDAEIIEEDHYLNQDVYFGNGATQSSENAFSGKYSAKVDSTSRMAFSLIIPEVKKGEIITVYAWKKKNEIYCPLIVSEPSTATHKESAYVIEEKDGWQKLRLIYVAKHDHKTLEAYCYNGQDEPAYFDDFEIVRSENKTVQEAMEASMDLIVAPSTMDSLKMFRERAIAQQVITKDLKKYFNATLKVGEKSMPVEFRFKGDWTDHLQGDKWSFRIKVRGDNAYQGMKSFSIQAPETRFYLSEWFAHQLLHKEDVLATRYSFTHVSINGEKKGVFAVEEHFDKQLLESQNRREAPILKFDEGGMWEIAEYYKAGKGWPNRPSTESAMILPFKKKRTRKNPVLFQQFLVGQNAMENLRDGVPNVSNYLDVDKMARYIALMDIVQGYHGLTWHNQRFYVNPVSNRLEPIGYDCMPGMLKDTVWGIIGMSEKMVQERETGVYFADPEFRKAYAQYLKEFATAEYLKEVSEVLEEAIEGYVLMLREEAPWYSFETEQFAKNNELIKRNLKAYEEIETINFRVKKQPWSALGESVYFSKIGLKVYTLEKSEESKVLEFKNYHASPVIIEGYITKNKDTVEIPQHTLKSDSWRNQTLKLVVPKTAASILFSAMNCPDTLLKVKIQKWPCPIVENKPMFEKSHIRLEKGKHVFTEDFVIENGKLTVESGAEIDLQNGAAIVVRGEVDFIGTRNASVRVYSSDHTGQGIQVIGNGKSVSNVKHLIVENMGTIQRSDWTLTGAVTFYESDVNIDQLEIKGNRSEDALNLIRCTFDVKQLNIHHTFSDGLDVDFGTGTIASSTFSETGNDAIDVSGSLVEIVDCSIKNAGDKGISGGEQSTVNVKSTQVDFSEIGVVSKDLSVVSMESVTVSNTLIAFAAFQKKPEYGVGTMTGNQLKTDKCDQLYLLDLDAILNFNGKEYKGTEKLEIESLYAL